MTRPARCLGRRPAELEPLTFAGLEQLCHGGLPNVPDQLFLRCGNTAMLFLRRVHACGRYHSHHFSHFLLEIGAMAAPAPNWTHQRPRHTNMALVEPHPSHCVGEEAGTTTRPSQTGLRGLLAFRKVTDGVQTGSWLLGAGGEL